MKKVIGILVVVLGISSVLAYSTLTPREDMKTELKRVVRGLGHTPTTLPVATQPTTVPSTQPVSDDIPKDIAWGKVVSKEFKRKVVEYAKKLGVDPSYLMACMAFESGRTFSPKVKNAAGSGAVGLIQFMPKTAKELGVTVKDLEGMTAERQLDYVYAYLSRYQGDMKTLDDVYMAILYPRVVGEDPGYRLFLKNASTKAGRTRYSQNRGLDLNNDGAVTIREATTKVRQLLDEGKLQAG